MKLRINPFNKGNPMTLKDAAILSTIVTVVVWILQFFASVTIGQVREDPVAFAFLCLQTFITTWAGTFMTLAGLEQYIKAQEKKKDE